jgi:AraC family transcriptional regulator
MTSEPLGRSDYVKRVNQAIDYVVQHLDEKLLLEDLARVACFSPFHFHRVFRSLVGETLSAFVRRLRLERALSMMSSEGRWSLTEVALACGFSSSSDFSRAFKGRFGVAPSAFDVKAFRARNRQDLWATSLQLERVGLPDPATAPEFDVRLRDLPARTVAYIRVLDPFMGRRVVEAANRLMAWADGRGLADGQWLGYMWDDPEIVAQKDCRYDVGLEVAHVDPDGEIGRFEFAPMLVAQVEVRGGLDLELRAMEWLFGTWLPGSGYVPDDQPNFEAWIGRPFARGTGYSELLFQLPVRRW